MKKAPDAHNNAIKVFCRMRPLNSLEKSTGGNCCIEHTDKAINLKVEGEENSHEFTFDRIFGPENSQRDVFNIVAEPVIQSVLQGFNGTIFAYGQTSSGKTFTMEGPTVIENDEQKGIIPRMTSNLFALMLNSSNDIEFTVRVSFLEIYNEKIQDLLDPRKTNLQIKEDKVKGIFVQDATEVYVGSTEQMAQVFKTGSENRTMAATRMNERSSRSHSIFVLHLSQKNVQTEATKQSKLYFVDLAGSEKIAKTNVTGQQLEEAKNINKSLTALGMVINALTSDKKENVHVPYRDSKLTRLLQESLGGNSQTSLILACSMCSYNDKETLGTLRFGNRAKSIKNTPTVNVQRSAKELAILLKQAEKKIKEQEDIIENLEKQINDPSLIQQPSGGGSPSKAEDSKEETEDKNNEVQQKPRKSTKKGTKAMGQGTASLTVLKQQIKIADLEEELNELKANAKELENELKLRDADLYELNDKLLNDEAQISELTDKNLNILEEFQVNFEKLCHESQEKSLLINRFKRAFARLKSDLNFAYISKNLSILEGHHSNANTPNNNSGSPSYSFNDLDEATGTKDDKIATSIQNTINILEELEKEFDRIENQNPDYEAIVDNLLRNTTRKDGVRRKTTMIKQQNLDQSIISSSNQKMKTGTSEFLSTAADEDNMKVTTIPTEESASDNRDSADAFENMKNDTENDEELLSKIESQMSTLTDEEKVIELQNLVTTQRKTISNLSKLNAELSHSSQKHQQSQDKKINTYKNKIEELQKYYNEKVKDYDAKMSALKAELETKLKEVNDGKQNFDKEILLKNQYISDLKFQNDRMQKIIMGNDLGKRVAELENKLKEFTLERQKLFEENYIMREDLEKKEDVICDKDSQIKILQNNLNTLSTELETLKYLRPKNTAKKASKDSEPNSSVSNLSTNSKATNFQGTKPNVKKNKKDVLFFDRQIIKPIRGGGGNVKNFERDNYFKFEKEQEQDDSPLARNKALRTEIDDDETNDTMAPLSTRHFSNEGSATDRFNTQSSFRKFDEILNKKQGTGNLSLVSNGSSTQRGGTSSNANANAGNNSGRRFGNDKFKGGLVLDSNLDDDDVDYQEVQQKLRNFSTRNSTMNQKSGKSFFDSVKKLFS